MRSKLKSIYTAQILVLGTALTQAPITSAMETATQENDEATAFQQQQQLEHFDTVRSVMDDSDEMLKRDNPAEYQLSHMREAVTADESKINRKPGILAPPIYENEQTKNMYLDYTDEMPEQPLEPNTP